MSETPQAKESLRNKLVQRVAEIKNEAVNSWKGMDFKDSILAVGGGMSLAMVGIVFGVAAGNDPVLIAVKALGGINMVGGAVGMVAGVVKSLELENTRPKK